MLFLSGVLLYLLSEFFIPIQRALYNNVQWILPLALIIMEANVSKLLSNKMIFVLLLSLLLCIGPLGLIPRFLVLSVYLMAFYVFVTSFILIKQSGNKLE